VTAQKTLTVRQAREGFFDTRLVAGAVDAATRRALSRLGAFVRQRAKTSIRKRNRPSEPGQPPSSHTDLLKRFLFFAWDPASKSVVVGPVVLSGHSGEALAALEHGGTSLVRTAAGRLRPPRRVQIRPRPFMAPALAAELAAAPEAFRDQIRPSG